MNYTIGILYGLVAQILTFIQIQGYVKYQTFKEHTWLVLLMGLPLSWLYMQSTKYLVLAGEGEIWPSRLVGFGVGIIVFTTMAYFLFGEPITMKTAISLLLAITIVCIQVFM
jgi:multidrug transporter EmrE-like cation transporter